MTQILLLLFRSGKSVKYSCNGARKKDLVVSDGYYYDPAEVDGFDDLKDRVAIDWGRAVL